MPDIRASQTPDSRFSMKIRHTFLVDQEAVNRARNAVCDLENLTLSCLVSQAIHKEVDRLEGEKGGAFPQRQSELKGGRPKKKSVDKV